MLNSKLRCEFLTKAHDYSGTSVLRGFTILVPCCIGFFGILPESVGIPHFGFAGILKGR